MWMLLHSNDTCPPFRNQSKSEMQCKRKPSDLRQKSTANYLYRYFKNGHGVIIFDDLLRYSDLYLQFLRFSKLQFTISESNMCKTAQSVLKGNSAICHT